MAQIPNRMGESYGPKSTAEKDGTGDGASVGGLGSWTMDKVRHGRDQRREKYDERWREYTRLWRGFWNDKDKSADGERSRIITPALQQAVEMTVSEMEEAVFNKTAWFDISDDIADKDTNDVLQVRDQLLEDFEQDAVPDAICKAFLLGAIYGTGIMKINVQQKLVPSINDHGEVEHTKRVAVTAEAVRPDEFVIDPSALNITEAMYVAHQVYKPLQYVKSKQASGEFMPEYVGPYTGEKQDTYGTRKWDSASHRDGGVLITEYHGLVPSKYLEGGDPKSTALVEAIVTIANQGSLMKVIESPYLMKDRSFVSYQHDTVPGEFWGRGVCEKGYNPQKALDAEVRARIDALALISAPMMGADITRIPRNADMRVRPGKTIFTRGRPSEIYEPLNFGNPSVLAHTFQQGGDLERMVQVGTGAMDTAAPTSGNRRNDTAGGMSMMQASMIKRSKRTMQNVERQFLDPFIKKCVWRYSQFNPTKYPSDQTFRVNATMGIMAKEVETQNLTQMMGYIPPESPAHKIILKAIFDNTASANKKELNEAIAAQMKGPSPEEEKQQEEMKKMQMQMMQLEMQEKELENQKTMMEIEKIKAEALHITIKADLEDDKVEIDAANATINAENARISRDQAFNQQDKNDVEREKIRVMAAMKDKPTKVT